MGRASRTKRERREQPEPVLIVYAGLATASGDSPKYDAPLEEDGDEE